jgi:hypothetical protein
MAKRKAKTTRVKGYMRKVPGKKKKVRVKAHRRAK